MNTASYNLENHDLVFDTEDFAYNSGKKYVFKFKDMPIEDRPREKMQKQGSAALSVAELVAVVLQTGTVKEDVMSMSARIVKDYGEQTLAKRTDPEKLSKELDIPLAKAFQIVACAELGRRFFEKKVGGVQVIRNSKDVFDYLLDMRSLTKEHLRGIYLDTHHRVIHDEVISIGTLNSNLVHPREVFKPAIEYGAAGVILAHNHPSGVITPSQADVEITEKLISASKLIGIPLVDHVVIAGDTFISIEAGY
jgi:DNA repair protein RadC